MKLNNSSKNSKRGIAMTEYLIILAIVAVAAIAVVGVFGKQVKNVFNDATEAFNGKQTHATSKTVEAKQDNFATWTESAFAK